MSLRVRIAAAAGVAVALTALASAALAYVAVRSNLRGEVERALEERARPFVLLDRIGPDRAPFPGPGGRFGRPLPGERFGGAGGFVQFVDPGGRVERPPDGAGAVPVTDAAGRIAAEGRGRALEDVDADGTHLMVLTVGRGFAGAVQVARPLTEVDSVLDRLVAVLVVLALAGIAVAALLGAAVARTALAPIAAFTRRTESIAAGASLSERIEVRGSDELARLASTFNSTLDALERAVESQRQLVADASHELRTPIASLRANLQTLDQADRLPDADREALRRDLVEELDELTALVGDVVELARGGAQQPEPDDVRLDDLVRALVQRAERRGDGEVRFVARLEPTLVRGDGERMSRAVSNLLANARKWSPEGGTVDVELAGGMLTVRDRGPGFAEEDLPHVFDRFYRARAARGLPGSGLGLAIVRQATEAHGGWAEAANAPDGGAVVRLTFGPPLTGFR